MDAFTLRAMKFCNNWFARLCERVTRAEAQGAAVTCGSGWEGKYRTGDLLRVHGAYTADYGDFDAGECYEVVSFDGETLILDHELHTRAPWLFVVFCEPPNAFVEICEEAKAYAEKAKGREGLQSESIDGYSWSAGTTPTGASASDWEAVYAERFRPYRLPRPTALFYAREAVPWR